MLNPDVVPLSKAMITGEVAREEMERDHPQKLCALDCADVENFQPGPRSTER